MEIDRKDFPETGKFMVMKKRGGKKPRRMHDTFDEASQEAVRLSGKTDGATFIVIQQQGRAKGLPSNQENTQ